MIDIVYKPDGTIVLAHRANEQGGSLCGYIKKYIPLIDPPDNPPACPECADLLIEKLRQEVKDQHASAMAWYNYAKDLWYNPFNPHGVSSFPPWGFLLSRGKMGLLW
jgi:hypothetical protein